MGSSALLVMDVPKNIVERYAQPADLRPLVAAVAAARVDQVAVIFVRVAFRAGYPDISPNNRSFAALRERGGMEETDPATQVWEGVAPQEGEVVVVKRRVGAFSGSGLDVVLRSMQIHHLVLAGIATSGVVLTTLRLAADLDYQLTVLQDGCLDNDPAVHRVLMQKVFPRQATVVSTADGCIHCDWPAG